jgi:hypothetical protein
MAVAYHHEVPFEAMEIFRGDVGRAVNHQVHLHAEQRTPRVTELPAAEVMVTAQDLHSPGRFIYQAAPLSPRSLSGNPAKASLRSRISHPPCYALKSSRVSISALQGLKPNEPTEKTAAQGRRRDLSALIRDGPSGPLK